MKLRLLLILGFLVCISNLNATILQPNKASFYTPHGQSPAVVLNTSKTIGVTANPAAPGFDISKKGIITLGIDQHHTTFVSEHHTVVGIEITKWATIGGSSTVINTSMTVDYKPNSQLTYDDKALYDLDGALKYTVKITSITVDGVSKNMLPANVHLDLELFVERLYDFTPMVNNLIDINQEFLDTDCDGINDQLKLSWNRFDEAIEYQLEWTFINDYTDQTGVFKSQSELNCDFVHNSTRISTVDDNYSISLIYPHGYLVYRIRAVGKPAAFPTKYMFGTWSVNDVSTINMIDQQYVYWNEQEWEIEKNWQYSASFAEEGKKKEVVSFFDGSLRNRQMVTVVNSTNKAIVGETIYDHQGRPSIQVLPTPAIENVCNTIQSNSTLKYYKDFNRNDGLIGYNRSDFDVTDTLISCTLDTAGMNPSFGASLYYSSLNTEVTEQQAYLPDAKRFPFSQVEYTPDNTGRIRRQGGVGEQFQLGSGHESNYFYGHPEQIELDRLFGSEVGDYSHYQKNMVLDPNGQVSISYLDQEGRVIATSLAGEVPENMQPLITSSTSGVTLNSNLLSSTNANTLSFDGMEKTVNQTFLISSKNTDVTFNYGLNIAPYGEECLADNICFNCVYDLVIDVVDDCGNTMMPANAYNSLVGKFTQTGGPETLTFSMTCSTGGIVNGNQTFTIQDMPIGNYQLIKTLKVNQQSLDFYTEKYLDPTINECVKTLEDFQNEYLANIDTSGCYPATDCEQCIEDLGDVQSYVANGYGTAQDFAALVADCELLCSSTSITEGLKNLMLTDVSPNGQYGEYLNQNQLHPELYKLSVYNVDNYLPRSFGSFAPAANVSDWQQPVYEVNGSTYYNYFEEDLLTEARVSVLPTAFNSSGQVTACSPDVVTPISHVYYDPTSASYYTRPQYLAQLSDFLVNFESSWANSLLFYHPEYNYLKTYLETTNLDQNSISSASFDQLMEETETWADAINAGFIKSNYTSFTGANRLTDFSNSSNSIYDPFLASTGVSNWGTYGSLFSAKLANYELSKHIVEIAAMIERCGNQIGQTSLPTSCYAFGNNASGVGAGDTAKVNRDARDADWNSFKMLYRSLKQKYLADLSDYRAINDGNYYGYNTCIGNLNFNPTLNGFFTAPMGGQFLNDDQPCYYGTAELYKTKTRRFIRPQDAVPLGQYGQSLSSTDPYSGFNQAAFSEYSLTGNCPTSVSISHLVNELITENKLLEAHFDLSTTESFITYLLSQGMVTNPPSPVPQWTWEPTDGGDQLDVTVYDENANYQFQFQFLQLGNTVSWSTVDKIIELSATTGGGLGYEFTAYAISGLDTIEVTGSTDLDILNCTFDPPCIRNDLGAELFNVFNGMVGTNLTSSSLVPISGSSANSTMNALVGDDIKETLYGVPLPNSIPDVNWKFNSTSERFEIVAATGGNTIRLGILSKSPTNFSNYSSIAVFSNFEVVDEQTFRLHGLNSSGTEIVTLTCAASLYSSVTSESSTLSIGRCEQPVLGCDDPAIQNATDLTNLLNDVLVNQESPYDLFSSSELTNNLINLFEAGLTSTSSTQNIITFYDDSLNLGITFISQTQDSVNNTFVITTIEREVTPTNVNLITTVVTCNIDGCDTTVTTSVESERSTINVYQTQIAIGDSCELDLNFPESLGYIITDVTAVNELIPTGEADINGNCYSFDLVVEFSNSVLDTISGSSCIPVRICDPMNPFTGFLDSFPEVTFVNLCSEMLINLANINAENAYNNYHDSLVAAFRQNYISHCMSATESFTKSNFQNEYHTTLYYYDQAGNLIKTVPPEGVEILPITSSTDPLSIAINNDRTNGTHSIHTAHRLETTYLYNSLNQLVAQHMPDMDNVSSWAQNVTNGLDVNLTTTSIQMLDASIGYLTGYVTTSISPTGSRGYLYKTTDGGSNWTQITNLIPFDLLRVKMASDIIGFAVGKSGVGLITKDAGSTWDMLNTHAIGIYGDFKDVSFESTTAAAFLLADGRVVRYNNGTLSVITPTVPPSSGATLRQGNSIVYNGTTNTYSANLEFVVGTSPDTLRFTQMAIINVSTQSTTYQNVVGSKWNDVYFYSNTEGYAVGIDGDLVLFNETSGGNGNQYFKTSSISGEITETAFLNKSVGLAIAFDGASKFLYKTLDGGQIWTLVSTDAVNTMAVVYQNTTDLYISVIQSVGKIVYYDVTANSTTQSWITTLGTGFYKLSSHYDSGTATYNLYTVSDNQLKILSNLALAGTTPPTVTNTYSFASSATTSSFTALKVGIGTHLIVNRSGGIVSDVFFKIGTFNEVVISPASTQFKDIEMVNSGSYVLGYENSNRKIHRLVLGSAAPSASSFTAINVNSSLLPSGVAMEAMDQYNGYITLVGSDGKIYCSSTQVTSTSTTNLAWVDRTVLRITPVNAIATISYPSSSPTHNAMAVGDNGLVLKRTTANVWQVAPMNFLVTSTFVGAQSYTPKLYGVSLASISSVPWVGIVGENGFIRRGNLNTNSYSSITLPGVNPSLPPALTDIAINTAGKGIVSGNQSALFYINNYAAPILISTTSIASSNQILNGVCFTPNSNNGVAVGNQGKVFSFTPTASYAINAIYGPRLNDVHFANGNMGTVAGANFFARSTIDGGTNWSRILPATINTTTLVQGVNSVWTVPTVAVGNVTAGKHFAVLAGVNYMSGTYNNVATPTSVSGTILNVKFNPMNTKKGYYSLGSNLYSLKLDSVTNLGYALTKTYKATAGATINGFHVFDNSNVMMVGNATVKYFDNITTAVTSMSNGVSGLTFNDVVFSDATHGYLVGNQGLLYKTDEVTLASTSPYAITAASWVQKDVIDSQILSNAQVTINCIAMPTSTLAVWGGAYNSAPSGYYNSAVRKLAFENEQYAAHFYYDRLGRIVTSQNSRQKVQNKYSYTLYDELGRVFEAGEKTENSSGAQFSSIFGTDVGGQYITSVIDDTRLKDWISNQSETTRKEVTRSYYDQTNAQINGNGLSNAYVFNPATQRKRIVHITYEESYDGNNATYDNASHYEYDIHGNVKTLIQDNKLVGSLSQLSAQRFKRLDYVYDLISGNVYRVDYQTGKADQWHHAYKYDADNRITDVYTTTATPQMDPIYGLLEAKVEPTISPYWSKEAHYMYYDHGPLARTVISENEVQGLDYVYNLQGWIKGVNSNSLIVTNDPGKDGYYPTAPATNSNKNVAADVMGYSLHYFEGDYTPVVSSSASFVANQSGSSLANAAYSKDLYNGNIARMVTTITHPDTRAILPLGNAYQYDQLNRLITARSFNNMTSNAWGSAGSVMYKNNFVYDANGNITNQVRRDETNSIIDSLVYKYHQLSNGKTIRNRLYHVVELASVTPGTDDIENLGSGTFYGGASINKDNNFSYDQEGRLIKDSLEEIQQIIWRVDGKVKKIIRPTNSQKKNVSFDYDAMGHRIAKHVMSATNALEKSTYYILDAQGNTMSVYERVVDNSSQSISFVQAEKHIYGSSRLGVLNDSVPLLGTQNSTYSQTTWTHTIGERTYELQNHLGNVLSVISDKVIPHDNGGTVDYFLADIRQSTDYSPFGVTLHGRNFTVSGAEKFRYGFQNQEMDDEIKDEGNSVNYKYRMHDPRLGRFFAIDPLASKYPHNSVYAFSENRVIDAVELEGLECLIISGGAGAGFGAGVKLQKSFVLDLNTGEVGVFVTRSGGASAGLFFGAGLGLGVMWNGGINDFSGQSITTGAEVGNLIKADLAHTVAISGDGKKIHTTNLSVGPGVGAAGTLTLDQTDQIASGWWETLLSISGNDLLITQKVAIRNSLNQVKNQMEIKITKNHNEYIKLSNDYQNYQDNYDKAKTENGKNVNLNKMKSIKKKMTQLRLENEDLREKKEKVIETIKKLG